jgi:radical SAM-linked protein
MRICFSKMGVARYIGHLDLHRSWERTLRRAGLRLAYSQGFNPQPKIQLASALPLGCSSEAEIVDIWLNEAVDAESVREDISGVLAPGILVLDVERVDPKQKSLQSRLIGARYEALMLKDCNKDELTRLIDELLTRDEIPRTRRGKEYDLRPLIEQLFVTNDTAGDMRVIMVLTAKPSATGRPEEVLASMGLQACGLHRTELIFVDSVQ